jgi:TPR repeat protein
MRNGDKLFDIGDFAAARAFFSRARELGDREASLHLGKTYDPVVFRDRNVQGLKPDPTLALKYYLEARTAGIEDADNAINGLETWLKQ